jgi:hypothetical protein
LGEFESVVWRSGATRLQIGKAYIWEFDRFDWLESWRKRLPELLGL